MAEIKRYQLPPTALMPNSPYPLLHYTGLSEVSQLDAQEVHGVFTKHGWQTHWIFRYGPTQEAHYHSASHECMVVLSGEATIRFGVADTSDDLEDSTYGSAKEEGGIEVPARAGDVFIIPAGTAHKTFNTKPEASFKLLTPGNAHDTIAGDVGKALGDVELSGFTMMGAYPIGCQWDFAKGGDHTEGYDKIWSVPRPPLDPVLGSSPDGLCGQWSLSKT